MATVAIREALRRLENDGWYLARSTGSRHHLNLFVRLGTVTIPVHKRSAMLPQGTWRSIQRQAGWR